METVELKPGDKLPTEGSLAARFQVSRGMVRTALNMLKNNRVVESVHRSGHFISKTQAALVEPLVESDTVNKVRALIYELKALNYSDKSIKNLSAINAVLSRGGEVIDFDYQVDQGSFAYLKEVISLVNHNSVS